MAQIFPGASGSSAAAPPAALPQVVMSKPLVQDLDMRLGFLGQFSVVSQVELRAQVTVAPGHLDLDLVR